MKILVVGGGSGGHVTPVVAVLREIKQRQPRANIRFWCDRKFAPQVRSIMNHFDSTIPVQVIASGKFRRYNHLTVMQHILWPSLLVKNIRDGFLVGVGVIQSVVKLTFWRPDVVFAKGGFVSVPVGFAAHLLHIPLVIHDSDAHAGLTNRILSRWATSIATGAPLEYYSYPEQKAQYVGVPVSDEFHPFTNIQKKAARAKWGIANDQPLIVITGGGLGATRINDTVVGKLDELLKLGSVVLISGTLQYDELRAITPSDSSHFQLYAFISEDMSQLLGAADVVITRAGATTIYELAALQKPVILVPNAKLTGGHQIKNAAVYVDKNAAIAINEEAMLEEPELLVDAVRGVLSDPERAQAMAIRLGKFARPDAASDVADMILKAAR